MSATRCPTRARLDAQEEAYQRGLRHHEGQHDHHVLTYTLAVWFGSVCKLAALIDKPPVTKAH